MAADERADSVVDAPPEEPAALPEAPRRPAEPGPRPRSHGALLAAVVVFLLLASGLGLWLYFRDYESTDDAQVDGNIHPISSRVAGYVLKVNIDDNQYVHAGDVLVEIDPRDYQTAVDKARAELADALASSEAQSINVPVTSISTSSLIRGAEADVENARAGVAAAQKQADAARANLEQAEANDARAQADLPRYQALLEKTEVSQQQYDQVLATARASSAAVVGARASLAAAEQQVQQAQQRLAQAQAALESARTGPRQVAITESRAHSASAIADQKRAELEQATLNLQYCKIVAPVDGVVNKNVETGMYVQPGQQLLSVVPLDDIWVTANFKETQLHWMRPGQPATITVDTNGRSYRGHVDSIAGASGARFSLLPPENATGNYVKVVQRIPVKIVLEPGENRDHQLRIGMSVIPTVRVR